MKLYMSDLYRVEFYYPLDDVQHDILYYLYQPLVGTSAIQVYMMLYLEGKRMTRFLNPTSLSRLTSFLSLSLLDIEKALQSLEAMGLLRTFVKNENNITYYIYTLQSPLSLKSFFKNQILYTLLRKSLSQDDFQKTIDYFRLSLEKKDGFKEVTVSFQDVYTMNHNLKETPLKRVDELKDYTVRDVTMMYDMDLFWRSLQDYQVPRHLLKDEDVQFIVQLGSVYSIDALTLAGMVKDAIKSQQLDKKIFRQSIDHYYELNVSSSLNEVHHKQPIQYMTQSQEQDPVILHMKYLDMLTPYELLKEKQGGSEPVFNDLRTIETLMVQLGLKPAVVNVLIEYVLGKNNNRLSKRYCESIGASWARKHIETALDAYHELMNSENDEKQPTEKENMVQTIESHVKMEEDEIEKLLAELKEGES